MLKLRPYQENAKTSVYQYMRTHEDSPCVVIPTAGGKTPIMASICKDAVERWNGRVLILAHAKELLHQTADKLRTVCPDVRFGVYSAGLNRRDTDHSVILAGIQSVYKRADELDAFHIILVDEAHLIPLEGDGRYRQFLADARIINPEVRIVGFTATPFRLKTGTICTPKGILNQICYEVGVRELIRDGYLCPLVTKAGKAKADTSGLHVRAGDFVKNEVEDLMDQDELVGAACEEIVAYTTNRKATLIFASSIKHGQHIVQVLQREHGIECGFVSGNTPAAERDETLARFQTGQLTYLCNVNVLTTGFDAPHIDCVALLRPTLSPGLYYQMVGRGFRLHEDKENCLVLDFGNNVVRHGPVDDIKIAQKPGGGGKAPAKECPQCQALIAAAYTTCPQCNNQFPPQAPARHAAKASEASILSGSVERIQHKVEDVSYHVHTKRGARRDHPKSLRVEYRIDWFNTINEFVCFEHHNGARYRAALWWRKRSPDPVPDTVQRAIEIIEGGGLAQTYAITVKRKPGERFFEVVDYELGPIPVAVPAEEPGSDDELPF